MDTESFIVYIKTDDIYIDIAEYVETRFDTSNFELDRLLPKGKNKKVIRLMEDKLGAKIMTKYVGLRAKIYIYLIDDSSGDKKGKAKKKYVIKKKTYKNCLEVTQLEFKNNLIIIKKNQQKIKLTLIVLQNSQKIIT